MKLVIVESPTKCHTIGRYLGDEYKVVASLGHVRDLATSGKGGLGVDVEKGFSPTYVINKEKRKVVNQLEKEKKLADEVILATDPDREGEAIAWHLSQLLKLDPATTKRLEFHEITRTSIEEAIQNPGKIDLNLVSSQETRRILDRIIGFKLSSLLQRKIKSRSAGRVQSVTLKLIVDREIEIRAFVPEEYWTITAELHVGDKVLTVDLDSVDGKTAKITNEQTAQNVLARMPKQLALVDIKKTLRIKESKEPFTTSTLAQEAFNAFKFKTKKTSIIAQKLYEGIAIGDEIVGLITYMRTDATRLSPTFVSRAQSYILETFGEKYLGKVKAEKESVAMQDAHEAIRPTSNHRTPESIRQYLAPDEYKLYKLIYDRAVASLMPAKREEVTVYRFGGNGLVFKADGVVTLFDGYTRVYGDTEETKTKQLPAANKDEVFTAENATPKQHFTEPPSRYSEAKVVKLMEEAGIGRPSTYAATIETLSARKYVTSLGGYLKPTPQGEITVANLEKYFPQFMDEKYTAQMEESLDEVVNDGDVRLKILSEFYFPFEELVKKAYEDMPKKHVELLEEKCPLCGSQLVERDGRYGHFVACSNYPKCKFIKKDKAPATPTGTLCPECHKPLVERMDKKGKKFVACSGYPKCHYIEGRVVGEHDHDKTHVHVALALTDADKTIPCPDCKDGWLIKKKGKFSEFLGCSNYPKCRHMEKIAKEKK